MHRAVRPAGRVLRERGGRGDEPAFRGRGRGRADGDAADERAERVRGDQVRGGGDAADGRGEGVPVRQHHRDGLGGGVEEQCRRDGLFGVQGRGGEFGADDGVSVERDGGAGECDYAGADRDGDDGAVVRDGAGEGDGGEGGAVEPVEAGGGRGRGGAGGAVPGERRGELCHWAGVGGGWGVECGPSCRPGEVGVRVGVCRVFFGRAGGRGFKRIGRADKAAEGRGWLEAG